MVWSEIGLENQDRTYQKIRQNSLFRLRTFDSPSMGVNERLTAIEGTRGHVIARIPLSFDVGLYIARRGFQIGGFGTK